MNSDKKSNFFIWECQLLYCMSKPDWHFQMTIKNKTRVILLIWQSHGQRENSSTNQVTQESVTFEKNVKRQSNIILLRRNNAAIQVN